MSRMPSRRSAVATSVWCGTYGFGRDDHFFPAAVTAARKYADKEPDRRPPEGRYREELARLRSIAPPESRALLDQLEHRWEHPDCPPALYVLSLTLRAPDGGSLIDGTGRPVKELRCTKLGEAKWTLAARFAAYKTDPLDKVPIVACSQELRVAIYGEGSTMPSEADIKAVAASSGTPVKWIDKDGRRSTVSGSRKESYVGVEIIDAICAFARQRERS